MRMAKLRSFKIQKPDFSGKSKENPKNFSEILNNKNLFDLFKKSNFPNYLPYEKLRYIIPKFGISPEDGWLAIRTLRNYLANDTVIKSESGKFFKWIRLDYTDEYLHKIDMYAGGELMSKTFSDSKENQLIIHGIMEEAIASSQLEGAHTTRSAAKKMLIEGIPPRTNSEQMILNNYKTIQLIKSDYSKKSLSLDMILDLHRELTKSTDIEEEQIGRLRTDKDDVVVQGDIGTETFITHKPPREKFLKTEIQRLISFANEDASDSFIHPVIKAIFLHFWLAYLHPFCDGNGRLARALFYWYLLGKGYQTIIYMPISVVIKNAPKQYAMAYIYSEQDDLDLTYFYDFHIKKILQALEEFKSYIDLKANENNKLDKLVGVEFDINERQKQLLHHLISDNSSNVTISSHRGLYNITRQTAAKDLKELENKGYIEARRDGKFVRYYPSEKLKNLKEKF